MGEKKGLIFGSMPCSTWAFLEPLAGWPDVVIVADGGLHCARNAGFSPNVYVGDDDSGGHSEQNMTCVKLQPEKDFTDLQAAYEWAKNQGIQDLILTGCTGGRQDHQLSALQLLETATLDGLQARILDDRNRITFLLPGQYHVPRSIYRYFSLIPVERKLEHLTIRGAKYPLVDRTALRGSSLTVSNEWAEDQVEISFTGGSCYLIEADAI
jgi:thiamine pyrophosphokinase